MKRLLISFCFFPLTLFSQKIDTVINMGIYKSRYSFQISQPLYVSYALKNGGGNCNRAGTSWKTEKLKTAAKFYTGSGYDRGHLANAEDFAFDCEKQALTFRYWNCIPQTPNLNRGVWKKYEDSVRILSQNDSLLVICGGIWNTKDTVVNGGLYVPRQCWKAVYSYKKKKYVFLLLFENSQQASEPQRFRSMRDLQKKIGYKITL